MQAKCDAQLLREYVEHGTEAAFAEIVARHTNLVYSAALRQVDSPDAAGEVTQNVFVCLVRAACSLSPRLAADASLSGWLCRSARNISLNLRRDEFRRHSRERLVMEHLNPSFETAPDWERLRPVLDEAMAELDERDYDALVMRFFKNQDLRSVGLALGVSDDTAQKRVSRALDKLRDRLSRRGITTSAAALAIVLSAHAVQAAPLGLAAAVSTTALAGTVAQTSTAIAATEAITMTTLQKTLVSVLIAASLATPLLVHHRAQAKLRGQDETLRQRTEGLARLRTENERLSNLIARERPLQTLPSDQFNEVLKLRGEIARLQAEVQELTGPKTNEPLSRAEVLSSMRQLYSDRISRLKEMLAANPAELVSELRYLTDNDWLDLVTYDHHRLDPDNSYLLSSARSKAQIRFAHGMLEPALRQYGKNNQGQFPTDLSQLAPYFKPPADASLLQGWAIRPTSSLPSQMRLEEDWVITQKAPVNAAMDQRIVLGMKNSRTGMRTTNDWFVSTDQP